MAAPFLTLQTVNALQAGWNAQLDQNLALLLSFVGRSPLSHRRVYWNSATQPSTGGDAYPLAGRLRDYPPALFQGCTVWIMDPTAVTIGAVATDSGDSSKFAFSDGTSWFWLSDPSLGAFDSAT